MACAVCTTILVVGCASGKPKSPSYDDKDLRPINQDLVAWMNRMNIRPPTAPVAAKPAIGAPQGDLNVSGEKGVSDSKNVTQITLQGASSSPVPSSAAGEPWLAPAETTVREALGAWASRAHWTVAWEARGDGPRTRAAVRATGDFVAGVRALLQATQAPGTAYPLKVEVFPRQTTVHVTDKE